MAMIKIAYQNLCYPRCSFISEEFAHSLQKYLVASCPQKQVKLPALYKIKMCLPFITEQDFCLNSTHSLHFLKEKKYLQQLFQCAWSEINEKKLEFLFF